MPPHVQGAINIRGRVIWILDVRAMLGMESLNAERDSYLETLRVREQDHIVWINELIDSVNEGREFTLATDPHKCGFGKWYDKLTGDPDALRRFANDQLALLDVVERFDVPHQRIHGVAITAKQLVEAGRVSEAKEVIQKAKDIELRELIALFNRARELLTEMRRGVVVVVEYENQNFGLLFDNSCDVKEYSEDAHQCHTMVDKAGGPTTDCIRDESADELIQVIAIEQLLPAAESVPA